jgi:hypothetical protein
VFDGRGSGHSAYIQSFCIREIISFILACISLIQYVDVDDDDDCYDYDDGSDGGSALLCHNSLMLIHYK